MSDWRMPNKFLDHTEASHCQLFEEIWTSHWCLCKGNEHKTKYVAPRQIPRHQILPKTWKRSIRQQAMFAICKNPVLNLLIPSFIICSFWRSSLCPIYRLWILVPVPHCQWQNSCFIYIFWYLSLCLWGIHICEGKNVLKSVLFRSSVVFISRSEL